VRALRPGRGLLATLDVGGSLALLAVLVVVGGGGLALLAILVLGGGGLMLLVLDISGGLVLLVVLVGHTGCGLRTGGRRSRTSRRSGSGSSNGRGGGGGRGRDSLGSGSGRSTGLELVVELASVDLAHVVPLPGIDLTHLFPVALLESIEGQVTSVEGFDVALNEGQFLRCISEVERGGEDTSTLEGEHSSQNKACGNTHVDLE
jgi:hypothetical protein